MGVNSLPKTVTRQRRGCDLDPGPSAPESSTLTTRLPSHRRSFADRIGPMSHRDQNRATKSRNKIARVTSVLAGKILQSVVSVLLSLSNIFTARRYASAAYASL